MITLFRHVRQSFLSENKFSKYILYAIGEIILVVIGILLALQINNWNENRKARDFEKNMLSELLTTINNDIKFFNGLEDRIKKKDTAIDNLLFARTGQKQLTDDRLLNDVYWASSGIIFSYNIGPYEALKSSGLDKVKTDSLRFKLTEFYEVHLPRAESFLQYYEDIYLSEIKEFEAKLKERGFFTEYMELVKEDNVEKGYVPKTSYNLNKYLTDPIYEEYLILNSQYKVQIWRIINAIISKSESLLKAIEAEINTKFKT